MQTEAQLQTNVARYLDRLPGIYWLHVPNEGKRSLIQGARLKQQGMKAGVPDILIEEARGRYHGLRIELKTKTGRLSDAQRAWGEALIERGYCWRVCRSLDEVVRDVSLYLSGWNFEEQR